MKCTSCGAELEARAKFCSYCGSPAPTPAQTPPPPITTSTTYNAQGKGTPNVSQYPTPPTAVPQYQRPQYQKPQYHTPPPAMQQNKRSGLVLAILSIIFSVFNGLCLVGLAFGIVGIVNGKRNGDKATYVCGIVGTVLCALAVLSTGYYGYHLL